MVRGTSRRVIVVDSPDTDLFEQAIFIVRSDAVSREGVTAQQLVSEACRVAGNYARGHAPRRRVRRAWLWALAAAALGLALTAAAVLL